MLSMTPDNELLGHYAKTRSEDAFAEIVRRHVNLVYSTALRRVNGDEHLARDVAQTVFTDLARKAGTLAHRQNLSGWLYTSAHFVAANVVRGENRRRNREEQYMREPINDVSHAAASSGEDWVTLRPALDDAMHRLKEADREALLLRYFENRQFAEVGAKLGLNEDAARKRVDRALDKLRGIFAKQGIATTAAFASIISANAIQTAPANLAATLATASMTTVGTGTTFTLLKIMTATQLKLGVGALVVAGVTTVLVMQHQAQNRLRAENEALQQQLAQAQAQNQGLQAAATNQSNALTDAQMNELLRLRGEVSRLRQQTNQLGKAAVKLKQSKPTQQNNEDVDPETQMARARMNDQKQLILGMIMYADKNGGQFPASFDQITNSFNYSDKIMGDMSKLQLVYSGAMTNIPDPASTVVIRETEPWLYNGQWTKSYGFADGHVELHSEPNGNFDNYEQQHIIVPANQ